MFLTSRAVTTPKLLLLGLCLTARLLVVSPTPAISATPLFSDGFESGSFSAWTSVQKAGNGSALVQSQVVRRGRFAARLSATTTAGSFALARARLATPQGDLVVAGDFRVAAEGARGSNVPVLRLFSAAGKRLVSLYRQNQDGNKIWVQHSGLFASTTGFLPLNRWARFELRVANATTSAGTVQVLLDGALVYQTTTAKLEDKVATVQIGNDVQSQAFTLFADDVLVTTGTTPTTTTTSTTTTSTTTTSTTTTSTTTTSTTTTTTTAPPPPSEVSYYVDADSGDDARAGTSPATAWRSLSKASQAPLQPGDRLLFERGGSWSGTLTLSANGTGSKPITVSAYGSGARPSFTGDCLELPGSYLVVTGLEVHDCTWEGIGINGHHNRVEDNVVRNNVTGIFVRQVAVDNRVLRNQVKDNNRMSRNTPECCDDSGAFAILLHGDRTEVAYNTISGSDAFSYDYGRDGAAIEVYGGRNNLVHHNLSIDNDTFVELGNSRSADNTFAYNLVRSSLAQSIFLVTRGGGSGYGPIARTTMVNNTVLFTGSSSQGFICHAGCGPEVLTMRNNIVQAVAKAGYADAAFTDDHNLYWGGPLQFTKGSSSIVADPRFVDPGSWDLHLRADSPAVDLGVPAGYDQDLDGASVPRDGNGDGTAAVDLGCYERQP